VTRRRIASFEPSAFVGSGHRYLTVARRVTARAQTRDGPRRLVADSRSVCPSLPVTGRGLIRYQRFSISRRCFVCGMAGQGRHAVSRAVSIRKFTQTSARLRPPQGERLVLSGGASVPRGRPLNRALRR
jgi:hypothetical protein